METHALASPERRWRPSVIVTQTSVSAKVGGARARGAEACGRDGGSPPCAKRAQIGLLSFPARTSAHRPTGPAARPPRKARHSRLPPSTAPARGGARVPAVRAAVCASRVRRAGGAHARRDAPRGRILVDGQGSDRMPHSASSGLCKTKTSGKKNSGVVSSCKKESWWFLTVTGQEQILSLFSKNSEKSTEKKVGQEQIQYFNTETFSGCSM